MKVLHRALLVALLVFGSTAWADDLDDALGGFDEMEDVEIDTSGQRSDIWDLTGDLYVKTSYNFNQSHPERGEADYSGLSKLQAGVRLQFDLNLPRDWKARIAGRAFHDFAYSINGRGDYTREVLNMYEQELEFQEVYLQGELLPNLDLKIGRQIVNWGRSDSLRVLDVLNPLDNREPGLIDLEDLRLPVTMTKLDYYFEFFGDWDLSGILIHERRFDEGPVFGSDFYPSPIRLPGARSPADWSVDHEYAFALTGIFKGWDMSLHYARIYNDMPHLEAFLKPLPVAPFFGVGMTARHARMDLYGASFNVASGSWMFKGEAGWFKGMRFNNQLFNGLTFIGGRSKDHDRLDVMLGVEYMGFSKTTLAFEVVNRHVSHYDSTLLTDRNRIETALRYTGDFFNDTLQVTALAIWMTSDSQNDGSILRLSGDYDLTDSIELGGGVIFYNGGDAYFDAIDRNDRIFFDVKYSF